MGDFFAELKRPEHLRSGKLALAEKSYLKALELDPNNPDALQLYGNLLAEVGRLKDSLLTMQRVRAVEPFVPILNLNAATVEWLNGQDDAAVQTIEGLPRVAARAVNLSQIYAAMGRYRDAADQVLEDEPLQGPHAQGGVARLLARTRLAGFVPLCRRR